MLDHFRKVNADGVALGIGFRFLARGSKAPLFGEQRPARCSIIAESLQRVAHSQRTLLKVDVYPLGGPASLLCADRN